MIYDISLAFTVTHAESLAAANIHGLQKLLFAKHALELDVSVYTHWLVFFIVLFLCLEEILSFDLHGLNFALDLIYFLLSLVTLGPSQIIVLFQFLVVFIRLL